MSDETTRVLLVEDNPGDARLLREALLEAQAENITLLHVDCLRKAFARLQEKAFDLVLLDLSLPDATGLDTLVKMHAHSSQLAIVVLTGLDDETLAVTAVREGAQDYLIKGQVDGKLLVRAIRYAIARKRQEQSLRESKQLLERTLHSLRDAVLIVDSETLQIIDCSPAAVSMFGYAKEEIQGREISFLHVDDAAGKEFGKHLHEIVRQKGFLDGFELNMRRKDGTVFPTERSVVPLEDRQGNRTGWVSVVRDITERKRAENEKQELQSQLAQSQKMEALGILAGGMAHEFNNINADVITYIDLALETGDLPISVRRKLEVARSSAVRGAEFTRSLLTFSKRDVGEKQPVSLPEIVDEILTITESELVAEGIELFVKHPPKLPPVMGNPGLLIQVVMNLVLNAKHAMLQSPVKKLAICTGLEKNGAFISVKDSGCGIPEKDIPRLWEPFFTTKRAPRNSQGHDRKMEGTGLGLSVSHSIIESHGGRIIVKSEPGKGATFKVYLPPAQFDTPIRRETRPGTSRPTMIIPTA